MSTIVVVDAKNLVSAAFYANWRDDTFDPTDFKALLTMMRTMTRCLNEWRPDEIVLMGDRRCQARYDLLPTYKGNRKRDPAVEDHKNACLLFARKLLPFRWVQQQGYEADDLMARFAERYHSQHKIITYTNDRDFVQVIQAFPSVCMYDHIQKRIINAADYPYPMLMMKAITGCSGDNIPSVTGEKTAMKLIGGEEDLNRYLDSGTTRTEKLPRRQVFDRNLRLVSLIGEHALMPPPEHFGFEPMSPIEFNFKQSEESLHRIFVDPSDRSQIAGIIATWESWICQREVASGNFGTVSKEHWKDERRAHG